jgi:MGT family glycosyltransferase
MTSRSNTPHTYLFALIEGGGTVPPELAAVRRLVERGHHVTVLAEDTMADEVRLTGAAFQRWVSAPNRVSRRPEDDFFREWECKSPPQQFERLRDRLIIGPAASYAADVRAQVSRDRPDLIVCSMFAVGAMVAAEAEQIPFDVLLPNIYILPAKEMPPMGFGLMPARTALGRTRDRLLGLLQAKLWNKGLARLNDLRTSLGLAPLATVFDQFRAARRQLILTSAEFDLPGKLPPNARYVGAVLDDPSWAGSDWSAPPGDAPLVLVSLSSTYQDQLGCLQRIVDALSTLPVRGLVTTGPALDPATIRTASNVSVVAAAPHTLALREAAALVTHGGHGTVIRSLAAGVPMAILHHGRDQADNAVRVSARGAGLQVKRNASPARIAAAVTRLLHEPSYRSAAAQLGAAITRDAASGLLVSELESLTSPTPTKQSRDTRQAHCA